MHFKLDPNHSKDTIAIDYMGLKKPDKAVPGSQITKCIMIEVRQQGKIGLQRAIQNRYPKGNPLQINICMFVVVCYNDIFHYKSTFVSFLGVTYEQIHWSRARVT